MEQTKPWWQSKTILVSIFGALFALAAAFNVLPTDFDQEEFVGGVLAITSALAALFRKTATAQV